MAETTDLNLKLGELEEELKRLKSVADEIGRAKDAALNTIEAAQTITEMCNNLIRPSQILIEKIESIDFPTRLEKLDATVSGINKGVQNLQHRFDLLERNLRDHISDRILMIQQEIEQKLVAQEKSLKTNRLLIAVTLLLLLVTFLFPFFS